MTRLSTGARRQRMLRIFYRAGGEGKWTRPFDDFPAAVRSRLLDVAAVRAEELPVLLYFRGPENWVLLTTEQVVTWQPESVLHIPWSEIKDATVDTAHVHGALVLGSNGKLALERLKILLQSGEAVELELEAGAAFFGFWNALKTVAALGKPSISST